MRLNCILQDLFRDTPLDHIARPQICTQFGLLDFWDTLMSTLCPFRIFPGITCYIFVSFIIHASLLFILVSSTCGLSTEVEVGFCGCLSAAHFIRVGQTWLDSLGSAKHRFIPTFPQNGGDKKTTLKDNIGELKHCVGT